jgi:hypothetical protein
MTLLTTGTTYKRSFLNTCKARGTGKATEERRNEKWARSPWKQEEQRFEGRMEELWSW